MTKTPSSIAQNGFLRSLLIASVVIIALMRLIMVFRFEVNWDEFLNLSMIYDHQRGDLRELLQTGFIHLFRWLPYVSENEVDQIIAARLMMFFVVTMTTWFIFDTTRRLASVNAALFAVLAYWSFSFTLRHGLSLRTDPLALCCLMGAMWLTVSAVQFPKRIVLAGVLIGLAGFFTIKAIFYLPCLLMLAAVQLISQRSLRYFLVAATVAAITSLAVFGGLIWLHSLTFVDYASPLNFIERTTDVTLSGEKFGIFKHYSTRAFVENLVWIIPLSAGVITALHQLSQSSHRVLGFTTLALALPLATPLIYNQFYPYFFPFVLASAAVVSGNGFAHISRTTRPVIISALVLLTLLTGALSFIRSMHQTLDRQLLTLTVIHETFAPGAPYIDARTMVSSFPKHGPFMSTWGMTDYRAKNEPIMQDIVNQHSPRFVLKSGWQLDLEGLTPEQSQNKPIGLLGEDLATLRENYLPFWGPIYIPGKTLHPSSRSVSIIVDGTYRVNGGSVRFNGTNIVNYGETVDLLAGHHEIEILSGHSVSLIQDLPVPAKSPPSAPLFGRF
ncbi:glycosyltransferase family 39 protein [Aliiroseovarius sp. KMU-50]|uniref:Glycosyltransferase family 39 protein n=1 Tax=Aliiroseovarius salicola TaxID=3009082 RepID=A0ABT4W5F3_9RHOB|nr:glycosyltransferase family 39 protein [Aliiroseovarius sp. KMU-50]MDA5095744.1 glycosyltransferase family 39 protein [Aliiroseovarius sp. KMU-50]